VRRVVICCALVLAALAVVPAAASAGTYADWECETPSGAPSAAAGFAPNATPEASAVNTCGASGGSLSMGLTGSGPWQGGLGGSFVYTAPTDTRIAAATVERATTGAPTSLSFLTYQVATDDAFIDGCLPSGPCNGDVSGPASKDGLNGGSLTVSAGCGGLPTNSCTTPIRMTVTRAAITLRDDVAPVVGNVHGTLFNAAAKAGTASVEFDAADRGGGVYRMITTIDGKLFEIQPAALGTCQDVNPSNSNPYEFGAKVPCPLTQAGLTVNVDTTKLTDGEHTIGIALEDAAGNQADVVAPNTKFTVRNAVPNGSPAGRTAAGRVRMWFAVNHTTRETTVVGRRVVARGYLRDRRGRGIRGAEIEVYHYVAGHRRLLKTGLRSRRFGRLTLILPLNLFGDSRGRRRIAFYYRALRPGPVTSKANLFLTILNHHGGPQSNAPDR
jgi:hypothetical protein